MGKKAPMSVEQKEAVKRELTAIILDWVRTGPTGILNYKWLTDRCTTAELYPQSRQFHDLLCEIVEERRNEAGCFVTAVVVRKDTRLPGNRFFTEFAPKVADGDRRSFHARQLEKAVAYWRALS